MGYLTNIFVALLAVGFGFIAMRSSETLRFIGDEHNPGILDLFKNSFIRSKVKDSADEYHNRVNKLSSLNDSTDENGQNSVNAPAKEQDSRMVEYYYNIVTDFYEYGWGQSFHFGHWFKNESFTESIHRHEAFLAEKVGIKPNDYVLDVGCGVGGPARHIHKVTGGAKIMGVTINEYQIHRANNHTIKAGLDQERLQFKCMDFTNMVGVNDNLFDRAYSIEATCHATDLTDVYREVYRVLKPGGVFGSYEWLTTDKYDKSNPEHRKIMWNIEYGSGLPPMHSYDDVKKAAESVGFEIIEEHDRALDVEGTQPWYGKLEMSYISTTITHYVTSFTEWLGIASPGSVQAHTMLLHAVDGLVQGGKTGTFTPMHLVVMRKPLVEKKVVKPVAAAAQAQETVQTQA